ncbi:MAG: Gfo/Idh/MocA family oxidoreductase [Clostridia bacterium]|nr:Gfo/Idh/MocA family oxidoreductase [Clostridia bacterium]
MIRLGTVGTSFICRSFLGGANLTGEFMLSAVYSRDYDNALAFAEEHGCDKAFCDLNEMAKSGFLDAVYISSPNAFHYKQSKLFLENGIHVLCEKPIVTNSQEYKELLEYANRKKLIYLEAIIPRHVAHYSKVKQALASIGKIRAAKIDFCQRSSRLDSFLEGKQQNIFDMSLKAGCLMDIGVYCVYGALDLLGEPKEVKAQANFLYNGADGLGSAILNYGDFSAVLTYAKTCESVNGSEIIGDNGTLLIGKISQYTDVYLIKDGKKQEVFGTVSKAELMSGEAKRFADYILRYEENLSDYKNVCNLTRSVHKTMDLIKLDAEIKYPKN